MTATLAPTTTSSTTTSSNRPVWRQGLAAGAVASVATTAVVVAARALDVPVDIAGEAIPVLGFAQMTLLCTGIGILLARVIGRRANRPQALFVKVTVALTALSFLPDVTADAGTATKVTLILTHLVAAAIVIPALARRLAEAR